MIYHILTHAYIHAFVMRAGGLYIGRKYQNSYGKAGGIAPILMPMDDVVCLHITLNNLLHHIVIQAHL